MQAGRSAPRLWHTSVCRRAARADFSPRQIENRSRIHAKGRKHYIVYTGILRVGMSMFVLTTLLSWYEKYGWHLPPRGYLWFSVILGLLIWPGAGYFWGALMWQRFFEEPRSEVSSGENLDG